MSSNGEPSAYGDWRGQAYQPPWSGYPAASESPYAGYPHSWTPRYPGPYPHSTAQPGLPLPSGYGLPSRSPGQQPLAPRPNAWLVGLAIFLVVSLVAGLTLATRLLLSTRQTLLVDQALIDSIADQVAVVRHLPWKAKVKWRAVGAEEMRTLLREKQVEATEEEIADLRVTGDLLKHLRLFPPDADIAEVIQNVLQEHTAGFFDPDTEELVVRTSSEGLTPLDRAVLAHELAHALAHQNFDLKKLEKEVNETDDSERSAAFRAFVEGEASLVMIMWAGRYLSVSDIDRIRQQAEREQPEAFDSAPRIVRSWIEFPYVDGVEFARALQEQKGWQGLDDAYADPPLSTKEILHPEEYLKRVSSSQNSRSPDKTVTPPTAFPECRTLQEGVIGELDLSLTLQEFLEVSVAKEAADGWKADVYRFEDCNGKKIFRAEIEATNAKEAAQLRDAWSQWIDRWRTDEGNYPHPPSFVVGAGGGEVIGRGSSVSVKLADDLRVMDMSAV